MGAEKSTLSIQSRYGPFRDLVPIYSLPQLIPNLAVVCLFVWLTLPKDFPTWCLPFLMIGWVVQFVTRPSVMEVSTAQAAWLEEALSEQGYYEWSQSDGRWRLAGKPWWQRLPHLFIEFVPGDTVTVIAPRNSMESIRSYLDLREEHETLFPHHDRPFSFQTEEPAPLPAHAKVPAWTLGAACVLATIWAIATSEGMRGWGISSAALAEGRFETIFLHMFAHGSGMHLAVNLSALFAIGAPLTARLGSPPLSWARFLLLFLLCGLAGAALYLLVHPTGTLPMVGASGALYGLFGLLIRAPADGEPLLSIGSQQIRRVAWEQAKANAFLFALLATMAWSNGTDGGLAWEAHLGGFLFGLLVAPKLLPRASEARRATEQAIAAA